MAIWAALERRVLPLALALAVLSATTCLPRELRLLYVSHVPDDPPVLMSHDHRAQRYALET